MFRKKKSAGVGRNRPVQPTNQPPAATVFSYHARRSPRPGGLGRTEPVPPAPAGRRPYGRWLKRGLVTVSLLLLAALTVLNLPVQDTATIVTNPDSKYAVFLRPSATYAQAAHELLGASLLNRNKLTLNSARLERDMRDRFPELGSATLSLPFFGTHPTIYIEPSLSALILTTTDGQAYIVDQTGRALLANGEAPDSVKQGLPLVTDESRLPITVGDTVLPSTSVGFITEVVGQLTAKQIEVESLTLPAATSELVVKVKGTGYRVKFNLQGDARAEAGTYLAVKQQLERENKTPKEYVDVRVPNRAYYK